MRDKLLENLLVFIPAGSKLRFTMSEADAFKRMSHPRSILLLRFGSLGDTIVGLPAIMAVRARYPKAHICLCSESRADRDVVLPEDILARRHMVDEFMYWPMHGRTLPRRITQLRLALSGVRRPWDLGIALDAFNPKTDLNRHYYQRILRWLGCRNVFAPLVYEAPINRTDELVNALRALDVGPCVQPFGCLRGTLDPGAIREADRLLSQVGGSAGVTFMAVGAWSNMPAKRWPIERFKFVLTRLIEEYRVCPVLIGSGTEELCIMDRLGGLKRALPAFGLDLALVEALLSRCSFYLGNDCGVMHLAAAVGLPCVAVFSARDIQRRWEPYGDCHTVFRHDVPCKECMLIECREHKMDCIMRTDQESVLDACLELLDRIGNLPQNDPQ